MDTDELNAPLGQHKKPKRLPKLPLGGPQLVAGALGLMGLVAVGWAALVNDPLGGEPVAVVAAKVSGGSAAGNSPQGDGREHARYDGPAAGKKIDAAATDAAAAATAAKPIAPPGSRTITIIDGSSGKSQNVIIPGNSGETPPGPQTAVDPKMLETTRHGAIPKVAADGARAAVLFAHPRALPANRKDAPRVALVIGGIGISASGTADAFSKLPAAVTFALSPYAVDLDKLAARANGEKHELLLQVPMEPFDYPDNDPGPQTLLTSLTSEQNVDRLQSLMSRFQGYVGIASFMGARFTATEQALAPVLREVSQRGLIYLDDGASSRSVASQIAGSHNLPFAKTDVVLDSTPAEIDRALARLEGIARDNGAAVGLATAQPAAIARIAEWAKKVESRGFVLVPISMVAIKAKSS